MIDYYFKKSFFGGYKLKIKSREPVESPGTWEYVLKDATDDDIENFMKSIDNLIQSDLKLKDIKRTHPEYFI